jgi:hypothetical protein
MRRKPDGGPPVRGSRCFWAQATPSSARFLAYRKCRPDNSGRRKPHFTPATVSSEAVRILLWLFRPLIITSVDSPFSTYRCCLTHLPALPSPGTSHLPIDWPLRPRVGAYRMPCFGTVFAIFPTELKMRVRTPYLDFSF